MIHIASAIKDSGGGGGVHVCLCVLFDDTLGCTCVFEVFCLTVSCLFVDFVDFLRMT